MVVGNCFLQISQNNTVRFQQRCFSFKFSKPGVYNLLFTNKFGNLLFNFLNCGDLKLVK